jgi:hypothetical protein
MWYAIMCEDMAGPYVAAAVYGRVAVQSFNRVPS